MDKIIYGGDRHTEYINASFGSYIYDSATKYEDNICQIDATLDQQETYGSFKKRSVKLALSFSKEFSIGDAPILICSKNNLDIGIVIAACSYLGHIWGNLEPTLSVSLTKHLITLVKPKLIFVEDSSVKLIEDSLENIGFNVELVVIGNSNKYKTLAALISVQFPNEEKVFRPKHVDAGEGAVLFFSSGSTGLPKAITHSFTSLVNSGGPCFPDKRVFFHFSTFYWVTAVIGFVECFLQGNTRIFIHHDLKGTDMFQMIQKYKITSIFMAPIITYKMVEFKKEVVKFDLSSLTFICIGGTKMSKEHLLALYKTFGKNVTIVYMYGMTEIGIASAYYFNRTTENDLISKIESCGQLQQGVHLKVVDPKTQEIQGVNQQGEFRIKVPISLVGYYNNPEGTKDIWDSEGFIKTGDFGYYDQDKFLYVEGRLKEMFKYLSWHMVPAQLEKTIAEHPAVKESVVFGVPRGDEGEAPAAYVVLKSDHANVSANEIATFYEGRVTDREKLRGGISIVEELPRTPTGKISRVEARRIYLATLTNQ